MSRVLLSVLLSVLAASVSLACGGGTGAAQQGSSPTAQAAAPSPSPTPQTVNLTLSEFKFEPSAVTGKAGTFVFMLTSQGKFPHDLHIAPQGATTEIGAAPVMKPGEMQMLTVTLQPGVYTFWCGVGKHRSNGMEGTLTVTS